MELFPFAELYNSLRVALIWADARLLELKSIDKRLAEVQAEVESPELNIDAILYPVDEAKKAFHVIRDDLDMLGLALQTHLAQLRQQEFAQSKGWKTEAEVTAFRAPGDEVLFIPTSLT